LNRIVDKPRKEQNQQAYSYGLNSQGSVFSIVDELAQLEQRLRWISHFFHDDFAYAPELVSVDF
jgi:hypothetical protein